MFGVHQDTECIANQAGQLVNGIRTIPSRIYVKDSAIRLTNEHTKQASSSLVWVLPLAMSEGRIAEPETIAYRMSKRKVSYQ